MTNVSSIKAFPWDGAQAFPNGVQDFDKGSDYVEQFSNEINTALGNGWTFFATRPLAQPGQAILFARQVIPLGDE